MDLVTAMSWTDSRVHGLIPPGSSIATFSGTDARQTMWMPDLTITNRNIHGLEVLSSGITIDTTGKVMKVDRMIVTVRNTFDARSFPWDIQEVVVFAASSTLMLSELQFVVAPDAHAVPGTKEGIFEGKDFALVGTSMSINPDIEGALQKSRARFGMTLARVSSAYIPLLIVPDLILVALGNSVFFLPLAVPFVMPRTALSVISVLSVLSNRQSISMLIPAGGRLSWMSVFDESVFVVVCACCMLNIFVEGVNHQQKDPELANRMNHELKRLMPALTVLICLACFLTRDPKSIDTLSQLVRLTLAITLFLYSVYSGKRAFKKKFEDQKANATGHAT